MDSFRSLLSLDSISLSNLNLGNKLSLENISLDTLPQDLSSKFLANISNVSNTINLSFLSSSEDPEDQATTKKSSTSTSSSSSEPPIAPRNIKYPVVVSVERVEGVKKDHTDYFLNKRKETLVLENIRQNSILRKVRKFFLPLSFFLSFFPSLPSSFIRLSPADR
jgi:hypothetical protein